ncbi:MAG: hypothetical protein AVDCRST_MAG79-558, partial [uncultured Thermoleophilia bacterium]
GALGGRQVRRRRLPRGLARDPRLRAADRAEGRTPGGGARPPGGAARARRRARPGPHLPPAGAGGV